MSVVFVCAGFCRQQVQDIAALTGVITDAASSQYVTNTEGEFQMTMHLPCYQCNKQTSMHMQPYTMQGVSLLTA